MSLFGQAKPLGSGGFFGSAQTAQPAQQTQASGNIFGQTLGAGQQAAPLGNTLLAQPQQTQQVPALSQSQAQLSSSLWQPGQETPRKSRMLWEAPRPLLTLR
ncbi:hypothetical protein THARTR1_01084 [Trichoderma harzianum]|uniref:Uncharacterized protein n=1 Tax=Trichoderma harzianum TaxID=5544 RepID=A0A2K0UM25_TRIHA|nr:hypothetical protein THARTR1_01084 [Trichoderma harzianum]